VCQVVFVAETSQAVGFGEAGARFWEASLAWPSAKLSLRKPPFEPPQPQRSQMSTQANRRSRLPGDRHWPAQHFRINDHFRLCFHWTEAGPRRMSKSLELSLRRCSFTREVAAEEFLRPLGISQYRLASGDSMFAERPHQRHRERAAGDHCRHRSAPLPGSLSEARASGCGCNGG